MKSIPEDPAASAGLLDEQVKAVAVAIPTGLRGANESGR
jgi:hypothetical protein